MAAEYCIGIGYEQGTTKVELAKLIQRCCVNQGLHPSDIATLATLDRKEPDGLMESLAGDIGCKVSYFSADVLEAETPRLANPSEIVFAAVGCHGVAEGAALAAAGPAGILTLAKTKGSRATCAIARRGAVGG